MMEGSVVSNPGNTAKGQRCCLMVQMVESNCRYEGTSRLLFEYYLLEFDTLTGVPRLIPLVVKQYQNCISIFETQQFYQIIQKLSGADP